MTRAVGLVLALTIASTGCRTTGGKIGGALAGTGVVFAGITGMGCDLGDCSGTAKDTTGLISLGAIVGGVAIAIIAEASYKPPVEAELDEASATKAQELTVEAQHEASRGQCAGVPALGQQVNALDTEYYTHVFYADPAIQRCIRTR